MVTLVSFYFICNLPVALCVAESALSYVMVATLWLPQRGETALRPELSAWLILASARHSLRTPAGPIPYEKPYEIGRSVDYDEHCTVLVVKWLTDLPAQMAFF